MGYRGKVAEQEKAAMLRAEGRTLLDIAETLGVSKSSVSLWVRDIDIETAAAPHAGIARPHAQHLAKLAEIDECDRSGLERIGALSDAGVPRRRCCAVRGRGREARRQRALREHRSGDGRVLLRVAAAVLRRSTSRALRVRVYLHEGLDLDAAEQFWSDVTGVPRSQFNAAYRAKADPTIRRNKHEYGCVYVDYRCSRTHREIMGLVRALLASDAIPG